jgi:hypothetical protein
MLGNKESFHKGMNMSIIKKQDCPFWRSGNCNLQQCRETGICRYSKPEAEEEKKEIDPLSREALNLAHLAGATVAEAQVIRTIREAQAHNIRYPDTLANLIIDALNDLRVELQEHGIEAVSKRLGREGVDTPRETPSI